MPPLPRQRLGVNIDHVATVRNARGTPTPDPLRAAHLAAKAGADGITAHLREDRRHIVDDDIARLMDAIELPLNFEMAATEEMVAIALRHRPHAACIVPEKREERTTEGGLDAVGQHNHLKPLVARLGDAGIRVSLFIEADPRQLEAAVQLGAPVVELHTGRYCEIEGAERDAELVRIQKAAALCQQLGLECHAGHGLNYENVGPIAAIAERARAQHRPLPGRRGDLRRPRARDPRDAPPDGRGARPARAARDPRPRQRPCATSGGSRSRWSASATASCSASSPRSSSKRSEGRATRAASYAKRFAAKEACAKALGTGLRRGVFWRDMGVVNQRGGKPTMALTGGALARLQEITPAGMSPQIDLTLTDEYPMAQAIVIISAVPRP